MKLRALKAAIPYTIPIFLGYLFLGIAFGVLLSSKGYGVGWALFMSCVIYAGSMQFVAVTLLVSPFNLVGAALMTLLVNARHLFYGLSLLEKFKVSGKLKGYMMFSLTDETYSLLCGVPIPENVNAKWFMFFISLLDQLYWILGGFIGALAGTLIKFNSTGIDFAMTALFIAIFVDQWGTNKDHIPALLGVGISLVCLLIFGADIFIIFALVLIVAAFVVLNKVGKKREDV